MSEDSRALQADDFSNPGLLWVETGEALFADGDKNCLSCHSNPEDAFQSSPLNYPAIDAKSQKLINLEGRINLCRTRHQDRHELDYESEELLNLTSFVKSFTRGTEINYEIKPDLEPFFDKGKAYFFTRRGQLNLSCAQCHDENWGRKMRGDYVSQGHINGFPAYRNDWQSLGSAHRRFEACDIGVRAEPFPLGSQTYLNLEVYLMARSSGLISETPAIRR